MPSSQPLRYTIAIYEGPAPITDSLVVVSSAPDLVRSSADTMLKQLAWESAWLDNTEVTAVTEEVRQRCNGTLAQLRRVGVEV